MSRHLVQVLVDIEMPDTIPAGGGASPPNGADYIRDIVQAGATAEGYTAIETEPYSRSLLGLGSMIFRIV